MAITLNGTTGIVTADGSVGAPGLKGTDADSGVSFAADSIKFSTGGVERMAISNTGVTGTGVGGSILQVVSMTTTTEDDIDAATWTDTGLTLNITPAAVGNKILVLISQNIEFKRTDQSAVGGIRVYRDSTLLLNTGSAHNMYGMNHSGAGVTSCYLRTQIPLNYLDTVPGTWSSGAINYKVQARPTSASDSQKVVVQKNNMDSTITLIEVKP
tara:strand:+ start:115 stop:753 length:639 start_codon:yes stop_codon:yes gene_type:complete